VLNLRIKPTVLTLSAEELMMMKLSELRNAIERAVTNKAQPITFYTDSMSVLRAG
jgi:hypothetical protein